jgi:hypothetical protein
MKYLKFILLILILFISPAYSDDEDIPFDYLNPLGCLLGYILTPQITLISDVSLLFYDQDIKNTCFFSMGNYVSKKVTIPFDPNYTKPEKPKERILKKNKKRSNKKVVKKKEVKLKYDPRRLLELHYDFRGEEKAKKWPAQYLSKKQRKKYRIRFINGLLVDMKGNLFDTRGMKNGAAFYVLSKDSIFYSSRRNKRLLFEHSSYVAGESVVCAGHIRARDGRLISISDMSAQYVAHPYYSLDLVVKFLKKNRVNFFGVKKLYWVDYIEGGYDD